MTTFSFLNACIWTAASAGTSNFVVSAAAPGYFTPVQCSNPSVVDGATYRYFARNGTQHEEGYGGYTSSTATLTRAVVLSSSNSGLVVNFSAAPTVYMGCALAQDVSTAMVTSIGDLEALNTASFTLAYLNEGGRSGLFRWTTGNYLAQVTNDPKQGIYVASNGTSSMVGAWIRDWTPGVYNVQWFGATGAGYPTDDSGAIQAAINFAAHNAGGTVLFPQGGYNIATGLTVTTSDLILRGVGNRYVSITSQQTSINMITVSAARCAVKDLAVFNQVPPTGSGTALITITTGCVQSTFDNLWLVGGYHCFQDIPTGLNTVGGVNCIISNCVMLYALGGSIVYLLGAEDLLFDYCIFDQAWPNQSPMPSNNKGSWASGHVYNVNDYVTIGAYGLLLQCIVAGTSSSFSVSGIWYGTNIIDGSVEWRIANSEAASSVTIDSNSTYIVFRDCDLTGSFLYGATITNSLGGVNLAPDVIRFEDCTPAGMISHAINIVDGRGIWLEGNEIQANVGGGTPAGIYVGSGFYGDLIAKSNRVTAGFYFGVELTNLGGTALIDGNTIFDMTIGINIAAGVSNFIITGNNVGNSVYFGANIYAIAVQAGASDYYNISNNRVVGASYGVLDAGTGTSKFVGNNF